MANGTMPAVVSRLFGRGREGRVAREARLCAREARRTLRRRGGELAPAVRENLEAAAGRVERALAERDADELRRALVVLDELCERHLAFARKSTLREYVESIGVAVLIALVLRAFVIEAFKIPSGSMIPTLDVGDHIFVSKFEYGFRLPFLDKKLFTFEQPKRGDVIVFIFPLDPKKDFIKRVVGTPGDFVAVHPSENGDPPAVWVNGVPIARTPVDGPCKYFDCDEDSVGACRVRQCQRWDETAHGHTYETIYNAHILPGDEPYTGRTYGRTEVPPGMLFVMGDNRDNSNDSRYWGFVPMNNVKGKALLVWLSTDDQDQSLLPIRWDRLFKIID